jgi:hypothetical protein
LLDFERLDELARDGTAAFAEAKPFPHLVIDDFLPDEVLEHVIAEHAATDAGWDHYHHYNEKKLAVTRFELLGEHTRALVRQLQSPRFLGFLEKLSGVSGLVADPELEGAGLHKVLPGGYLNIHADFLTHGRVPSWTRQINLILFLNRSWQVSWGGDLEFWEGDMSRCGVSIPPIANRCVIFHTTPISLHGHPSPLACPEGQARRSLALYYFRQESVPQPLHPTHYYPRPGDPRHKRLLVAADRLLLHAYALLKRYTRLQDRLVSRLLKHL